MNPATDILRRLVEAGADTTYPCPCMAHGRIVEIEPAVFLITYEHDDWCPKLTGRDAA